MEQHKPEKLQLRVAVIPMLELGIKNQLSSGSDADEDAFIMKYVVMGQTGKFLETPDGWFFALHDLLPDIKSLAKYILHESADCGEFQICGGIQIAINDEAIPTISSGSSFQFAMDVMDNIMNQKGGKKRIFIDNDKFITCDFQGEEVVVEWGADKNGRTSIPLALLREKIMIAKEEIRSFAQEIQTLLLDNKQFLIELEDFRFMFGLQRR